MDYLRGKIFVMFPQRFLSSYWHSLTHIDGGRSLPGPPQLLLVSVSSRTVDLFPLDWAAVWHCHIVTLLVTPDREPALLPNMKHSYEPLCSGWSLAIEIVKIRKKSNFLLRSNSTCHHVFFVCFCVCFCVPSKLWTLLNESQLNQTKPIQIWLYKIR